MKQAILEKRSIDGEQAIVANHKMAEIPHQANARSTIQYDLFEIGRSCLGNPGVVVGSETRFVLHGMNLALQLRHLVD
jgi:hypothetical protein